MSAVRTDRPAPHVLRLTIDRPAARNAINGAVTAALDSAVRESEADADVRVVVLTGAGDQAFCAGADLKAIAAGQVASLYADDGGFGGLVRARRHKPWIAAVNGFAYGGGLELALSCDMIVAAAHANFGLPEVKRGLAALAGGVFRLPRRIPRAIALEMIATGDPIDAARAAALGLVNRIVAADALADAAVALAGRIAANAPLAVRESLILARLSEPDETGLWEGNEQLSTRVMTSDDAREGPRAFMEKRPPIWNGR